MHLIQRLYQAEFDFSPIQHPKLTYMVATIPRSGSTFFALQLWRTGVLGSPLEFLNLKAMAQQAFTTRFDVDTARAFEMTPAEFIGYWNAVRRIRTSPNGVFGYKMFMLVFRDVMRAYPYAFEHIQPDFIIYFTREDLIAQAISYSKALQSKAWFADLPLAETVRYDYEHILECKRKIELQAAYWEGVFAQAGITPIRVTYEEMLRLQESTLSGILEHMGIRAEPANRLNIPLIRKQADSSSAQWRTQFEHDARSDRRAADAPQD